MSAFDEIKKNLGNTTVKPLDSDLNKKGTTQPVTAPKPTGSALGALRANLGSSAPTVAIPKATPESPETSVYGKYSNQVIRKVASFDAGFIQSVGQLARSFQWLGDRVVGDRIVQDSSDKLLQAELKAQDDLLKLYRKKRDSGDAEGAQKVMKQLKTVNKNQIPYEAYADTNDSIFYKAQDKTKEWADILRESAGITPENSKFSDRLFEGAGSSATYFVPSLGIAKGASVLAKVSPRIAMLFGGSAGASLEAMAEAGSTFDEWKKKGDLQKAGEESSKVFLTNAILLGVTNNLGVFNPAKLGLLKRTLLSSPVEGLQEAVQQVIQNEANNRPLWEGVLEAGTIGAIIGSVMGGVTDAVTTQTNETEEGYRKGSQPSETSPQEVSPALATLREKLNVTPAIEQQRAIEGNYPPQQATEVTPKEATGIPEVMAKPKEPTLAKKIMENGEQKPTLKLKRDVQVTTLSGEKVTIPEDEVLKAYESGGKALLKDGREYIVSKSQYENIKNNSLKSEAKEFAPELKDTEETVKGGNDPFGTLTDEELRKQLEDLDEDVTGMTRGEMEMKLYQINDNDMGSASNREKSDPKYSSYQLPDGKNYKEVLIKAPVKPQGTLEQFIIDYKKRFPDSPQQDRQTLTAYYNEGRTVPKTGSFSSGNTFFKSSHWDEPNVVAHLRLNERTYNGKKVTFMEELQSDWAREGRSKGFATEIKKDSAKEQGFIVYRGTTNMGDEAYFIDNPTDPYMYRKGFPSVGFDTEEEAWGALTKKLTETSSAIPNNPLLKNWQELSIKRALKEAVDNNSEYFAWINGEQTSARYNLATQVKKVIWEKTDLGKPITIVPNSGQNISIRINKDGVIERASKGDWEGKKLDEVLGKGLADKIMEKEEGTLSGEGLKFGGEWAINLYDKQVKNIVEDLTGAKVEVLDMGLPVDVKKMSWYTTEKSGDYRGGSVTKGELNAENMEVGGLVKNSSGDYYIITDVLGNGKFEAVAKSQLYPRSSVGTKLIEDGTYKSITVGGEEYLIARDDFTKQTFDISTKKSAGQQAIKITPEIRAMVKGEAPKLETKTQTELVKEAVSEKPKTIKQIAEELGIKEPNVRRILGQGAKSGMFERVEKGVYILNNGKEDIAFIHTADAVETLPRLAKEGLKVDMVFLDIPYDTPAVKGGSRGVKYELISPEQFKTIVKAVSDIVRTDETPVYYMFSQAESGMKAMMKYNEILTEGGFKAVAKGNWQKMFDNGKPVTNVRGVVARPEGILLLNKKGEFIEKDAERNLDFTTRRPKGYSTEKPAELLNSLILQGTKEGDTVLDPFAGSGVTGAEAVKSGRKAVLIEKNKEVSKNITQPRVKKALDNIPPATSEEATDRYWNEVLKPRIENGEALVIGADDLKYHFGNDYDINRHPLYSKSANQLFERAVTQSKEPIVKFVAGGTGSGKSDFIVPDISKGFAGVIYDSTAWNPEGLFKQMDFVKSQGKSSKVYGIVPDLRRSRAYTFLREEAGKHPVTEQAFVNTHSGSIQTMLKVIEQGGDVYVLDTRTLTTPEQVDASEYVHNPVALLEGARYSKDYVKEQIRDITAKTAREVIEGGQGSAISISQENRPTQELVLEVQEAPKDTESKTQTEVQGQKVNRFTGAPQEEATPRVQGQLKPLITKTGLKTIFSTTPAFRDNPYLTVTEIMGYQQDLGRGREYKTGEMVKRLSWESADGKTKFALAPEALGLVAENLSVGDKVRVSRETLSRKGQEFRVIKYDTQTGKGSAYASVGRYRDNTEIVYRKPETLRPIQFPELVALAKELSGNVPFLRKYRKSNGMFYARDNGEIGLNPELFKRENLSQLQATLAHEIGHLTDYLPDHTMQRGNLMGRLNTLKGFMKEFYAPAGVSRTDSELRTQMYELSKYWRPYDEETASASFKAYRKSAPEIYADFISALFNEPKTVSEIAPTAYNVFFEQLDRKPAVKQAYFELQELLRTGDIIASRRSATTEMFKLTEQESRERQIQNEIEAEQKRKSVWFNFKTQAVDITEAVKEKVKEAEKAGKKINDDDNPTYYLEERNYLGGKIKTEVEKKFNTIYQELQANGMTWEDLGELMFYERVLKGDRQEIANPLGYQPEFVQELMEIYEDVGQVKPDAEAHEKGTSDIKTTLGAEKYAKLQELANQYRENLKGFFKDGYSEGIYSDELNQLFEENAFYVPFKGAKYSGVTRTTFGVKQQKGTLGNIENPANTGIEKAVSIIRAIERNRATRKTINFFQENFAEEVQEPKLDKDGHPMNPPKDSDLALVTYMEEGKVRGFYVDKYIADAIQKNTIAQMNLAISSLRFVNSRLFRPLFITFNLGFQTFNLIRDFKRFWKNVPNMTVLKAMRLYGQSARASKIRAFGLPNNPSEKDIEAYELISRLENEQVLSVTYNDIIKGEDIEDAQIERILREVGVRKAEPTKLGALGERIGLDKKTPIIKQAFAIMDFIENLGNMIETLPKVAGVKALEDKMPPREMRSFVRRYVGSPDFMAGGKFKPYMNEVFLFSNAIFQGIRSDYEIATQPKSRGAYWLKTAQSELVPKILMLMAIQGLFGEWLKEAFGKIGEYDKTNYTIVPLGIDQNGKTVYFRVPSDESGRLIGGTFWKVANSIANPEDLANMDTYTDILSYAGGQVPSLTPTITTTMNIADFLAGNNPHDFFRNRPVLTTEQMQAGGMEKTKPFLSYLFQQMGGGVVMKLYTNEQVPSNPSLSEKISSLPIVGNIAGRFIKASDYGETEKIREVSNEVRSERAKESIANRKIVFDYVDRAQGVSQGEAQALRRAMIQEVYGGFPKTPEDRVQARNLEKRFDTLRLRGTADTRVDALIIAPSNEEKVALLQEYRATLPKEKFEELKRFIIKNRVVSSAVFQAFNRVEK